ncbi:MAG: serine hydrolase [Dorea sp.]|nr:serine hydrolase [Dorea sp.]
MARDQVAVVEMITDMILGKTEGVSRVDFTPQKIIFPEDLPYEQAFERATPESQGISSKRLLMLIQELNDSEYTDMHHLMILKGGKVICECSFAPYRSGMWHITHSMCKSITGMAVGMLIEEGQLSLDENIYKIFEQRMNPLAKIFRPEVTVEHLLTMTSGVSFNESGIISGNDWLESYLNAPVIGTPGTKFQYNSLNSYVLSAIISERTGMTMEEYLRPRLFEPMGITRYLWETCPKGITKGGWGLFLCAEDMAKLGQLYLNKGRWNGQQLVSEEWVETSTQKHVESGDDTFGYGYQIWMEERQGSFEFNGMLGQNVVVYPDMDMVIVTNAGNNELFQNCVMLNIIRKYFSKDYQPEERLPENPREYEKLRRLTEQVQYGISRHDRIRRGGWKKKCGVTRSHALHSETYYQNNQLDGKCYEMKPQSVGLYPLVIQVFHNNMTEGVRKIAFRKEGEDLFICFLEGEQWCELKIGFQKAQDNWLTLHEESYLVAVSGVFSTDADGNLVLKLEMAYLEEAVRRRIYFYFRGNEMEARWYETPGKALIMEGLESITEDLTRHPIYNKLKEWGGMDLAHRLMEQTIEPVIRGYLEESVQDDSDES